MTLFNCIVTAKSKDCALGEFYRRIKSRRGAPVAIVATARKIAELYWRAMVKGMEYVEAGLTKYKERIQAQATQSLFRKAAKMGYTLQPINAQNPA